MTFRKKALIRNQNYFQNFFLLNFLLSGSKKTVLVKLLIFFSLLFAFVFAMNIIEGSLLLQGSAIGFVQDYANYFYFLSFFISTYLFRNMIAKFISTFSKSEVNSKAESSPFDFLNCVKFENEYLSEFNSFVDKQISLILLKDKLYRKRFYIVQALIFIIFLWMSVYLPIYTNQVNGNWNFSFSMFPIVFISNQIKDFVFWVIITPPLIWGAATTAIATIKICKKIDNDNRFDIRPLSPDRAGGLKQLGGLTLILFYIVIVQFSHIFATSLILGFPISHQVIYPFYFLFTAFIFLYPTNSVRKAMKDSKEKELGILMKLFDHKYQKFRIEANDDFRNLSQQNVSELLEIKSLYKQVDDMPIWPFDIDTLIKFISIFIIPLLVFIIQLFVDSGSIIYNLDKLKIFENFK